MRGRDNLKLDQTYTTKTFSKTIYFVTKYYRKNNTQNKFLNKTRRYKCKVL